jgi:hypothetical protein
MLRKTNASSMVLVATREQLAPGGRDSFSSLRARSWLQI